MSGPTFPISPNEDSEKYCFKPLTCVTPEGYLIVWTSEKDTQISTLKSTNSRVIENKDTSNFVINDEHTVLDDITNNDTVVSLTPYTDDIYILLVEYNAGYTVYYLDREGSLSDKQFFITQNIILKVIADGDNTVLFMYNYSKNTLIIGRVQFGEPWTNWNETAVYYNVWGIPQINPNNSAGYTIAWITEQDTLTVISCNIMGELECKTSIKNYNVDYLMGSKVDQEWVVFGGYYTPTRTLRLDFLRVTDDRFELNSRYWKSEEYYGLTFSMVDLPSGFMLLADGPNDTAIRGQRFTHLGSWLYPMLDFDRGEIPSWCPSMACKQDNALIVYIKDYSETANPHSEVWCKWLQIGSIPELEGLSLRDL